jgi:hypothetical protein
MDRYERDWRDDDRHSRGRRDEGILERIKNDVKAWFDDDDDNDARDRHRGGYSTSSSYGSSRGSRRQDWDRDADRFRNLGSRSRYGRHSGGGSYGDYGEDYNYPRSSYGGGRGYEDEDRGYGQGRNYRSGEYRSGDYRSSEDYGRGGNYGQGRDRSGTDYSAGYGRGNEGRYGSDEYGASSRSQGRGGSGTPIWLYSEYYWVTPGPHSGVGPRNFERSSDTLKERVCERLQGNGALDAAEIDVEVDAEEVTLTGTVKDRRQKRMAEECAESVYGVRDVHNRLSVKRDEDQDQDPGRSGSSSYGSAKRSVN